MSVFHGRLYDGRSSNSLEVEVRVDDEGYLHIGHHQQGRTHFKDVRLTPRMAGSVRFLDLPDGSRIETADHEVIDQLTRRWQGSDTGLVHKLENHKTAIAASLSALAISVYLLVVYGIPFISNAVTAALPVSLDDSLGGEVLEQLDDLIFRPTTLAGQRQSNLRAAFATLVPDSSRQFSIEFRDSEFMGANAIALPNGQIVFTDQLVELTDDDEMLEAIMLHEIGHVVERHAMRSVIGQAGLSMLVFVFTGDVNSASTALVVMLPGFFLQSRYSRSLEWEADTYALQQMLNRNMDPNKFADIMERIMVAQSQSSEGTEETDEPEQGSGSMLDYFQSHPPSRLRIERFREAAGH